MSERYRVNDELEKIVESSVDDVIKNEITEKKLNRVLSIFTDDKEGVAQKPDSGNCNCCGIYCRKLCLGSGKL